MAVTILAVHLLFAAPPPKSLPCGLSESLSLHQTEHSTGLQPQLLSFTLHYFGSAVLMGTIRQKLD